jgi:hypothetical protein
VRRPRCRTGDAEDDAGARHGASVRHDASARRARFGLLLIAIATVFVVQGVASPGQWQQVLAAVLLAATLVLALRVADMRPTIVHIFGVVGFLLVTLTIAELAVGNATGVTVRVANLLLVTLAPPAVALGTIRTMSRRNVVTVEAVLGVLCLYLLIGMFFAALYSFIDHLDGTFFAQNVSATTARCLYFSFTTLTTVGYGDLTANSNLGHTLSISEALVGQIYLVTIVSLIVGNLGTSRRRDGVASSDR